MKKNGLQIITRRMVIFNTPCCIWTWALPPRFQIPFGFVVYLCPEEYLLFMKILIVEDE